MKRKYLLLFMLLFVFSFGFVGCGPNEDQNETIELIDPVVIPFVLDQVYYAEETELREVPITLGQNSTSGTIEWVNKSKTLEEGEKEYDWQFTPTDVAKYKSKTGKCKVTAIKRQVPTITVSVAEPELVYEGMKLNEVELGYAGEVEGTLSWLNKNYVLTLGRNECAYRFTPNDTTLYKEVDGRINVEAKKQYATGIQVKTKPQKTSYNALETVDLTGLELTVVYNKGKTETVNSNYTIKYNKDTFLHGNDESVTIRYTINAGTEKESVAETILELNVSKIELDTPVAKNSSYKYTGEEQELDVREGLYSSTAVKGTDAGIYNVSVTLFNDTDYKWKNFETSTINIEVEIEKIEAEVTEVDYSGIYDEDAHSAKATTNDLGTIYYSAEELNAENYLTQGSTEELSYTNATSDAGETIYYYIHYSKNYLDAAGTLNVKIEKQTPTLTLEYCYTVESGAYINYPASYVSLKNNKLNEISAEFTYTYYFVSIYDSLIKTDVFNGESQTLGGAPKTEGDYVVEVSFAGNSNYNSATERVDLYIDSSNNGFYESNASSQKFAFKEIFDDETNDTLTYINATNPADTHTISITNANRICSKYVEFELATNETTGLLEIRYHSKFGVTEDDESSGILMKKSGSYKLVGADFSEKTIALNQAKTVLTVGDDILGKWNLPNYTNTYKALTNVDKGDDGYSTLKIYNDFGTIRFEYDYNAPELVIGNMTIKYDLSGIIQVTTFSNFGTYFQLNFILQSDVRDDGTYFTDNSNIAFAMMWNVKNEPSELKFNIGSAEYPISFTPYLSELSCLWGTSLSPVIYEKVN